MPVELILAVNGSSIDAVAEALCSRCGQSYECHDSLYLGEYNQFKLPESLQVKNNFVEAEQEWDYPEFKRQNILLAISATERPEYFRELAKNSGFEFKEVQCKSY
jgi:hypothetical protein